MNCEPKLTRITADTLKTTTASAIIISRVEKPALELPGNSARIVYRNAYCAQTVSDVDSPRRVRAAGKLSKDNFGEACVGNTRRRGDGLIGRVSGVITAALEKNIGIFLHPHAVRGFADVVERLRAGFLQNTDEHVPLRAKRIRAVEINAQKQPEASQNGEQPHDHHYLDECEPPLALQAHTKFWCGGKSAIFHCVQFWHKFLNESTRNISAPAFTNSIELDNAPRD